MKVWISYARFEQTDIKLARGVFERGNTWFRENLGDSKEERLMLLENWLGVEQEEGSDFIDQVKKKFPKRVKKRRKVKVAAEKPQDREDGAEPMQDTEDGWEEYYDYIFPEDEAASGAGRNMKLLQMAAKWKQTEKNNN